MLRALLDWEEMSARARAGRSVPAAGTRQIPQKTGALRLRREAVLPRAAPQPSRTGRVPPRPEELTTDKHSLLLIKTNQKHDQTRHQGAWLKCFRGKDNEVVLNKVVSIILLLLKCVEVGIYVFKRKRR